MPEKILIERNDFMELLSTCYAHHDDEGIAFDDVEKIANKYGIEIDEILECFYRNSC